MWFQNRRAKHRKNEKAKTAAENLINSNLMSNIGNIALQSAAGALLHPHIRYEGYFLREEGGGGNLDLLRDYLLIMIILVVTML